MTAAKWGLFFLGSLCLYFGLTEPIIRIGVSLEDVVVSTIDQNPILGVLLQQKGVDVKSLIAFLPAEQFSYQSILSSVQELFRSGSCLAAIIILVFSIVFPILKQGVILLGLIHVEILPRTAVTAVQAVHKWAMIDVFVISSVVITLSNASAWSAVFQSGFYWFAAYFFITTALMYMIKAKPAAIQTHNQINEEEPAS
ncbi:MAG: paraquat-inducible protein A [Alphaproteobacteria bacterium]